MADKKYILTLGDHRIGETMLEEADAPMGVVFGKILFDDMPSPYVFFQAYCAKNNIVITSDDPGLRCIITMDIPDMRICDSSGGEIKGLACSVYGMDAEGYEVVIEAIPYPFYGEEFSHHVITYNEHMAKHAGL